MKRLIFAFCILLSSCSKYENISKNSIIEIKYKNFDGTEKKISSRKKINDFESQKTKKYQQVQLNYKDFSIINSYYENGRKKQSLEVINKRANGIYKEWYINGNLKIEANIIDGYPSLDDEAKASWLFNGKVKVFFDNNITKASIDYLNGKLHGNSFYFFKNGNLKASIVFEDNEKNGKEIVYAKDGYVKKISNYKKNKLHGEKKVFFKDKVLESFEIYKNGLLKKGDYFNEFGEEVSKVKDYNGIKTQFSNGLLTKYSIKNGDLNGFVKIFKNNKLLNEYFIKDNKKHGREIIFYDNEKPKIEAFWLNGILNGTIRTWYPNGNIESKKTIYNNKKNEFLYVWYSSGDLMIIEEYKDGKIKNGQYFKKNNKEAISSIVNGYGTAIIFDDYENIVSNIKYEDGYPTI